MLEWWGEGETKFLLRPKLLLKGLRVAPAVAGEGLSNMILEELT